MSYSFHLCSSGLIKFNSNGRHPTIENLLSSTVSPTVISPVDSASLFPYHATHHLITQRSPLMPCANARHILVDTEAECLKLKAEIEAGGDFAEVARANSSCHSRMRGGDLGTFAQGQMVREFDEVVFS